MQADLAAAHARQRAVPLDFLVVQAFDTYELERMGVAEAAASTGAGADARTCRTAMYRGRRGRDYL